jgi:DNA-directed RNA polymerase sigma subunit (sigma70/sigma32)
MNNEEVAKKLNITPAKAEQIYKSAIRKLKKTLPKQALKDFIAISLNDDNLSSY